MPQLRAAFPGLDPVEIPAGAKVRLMGPNGCGKTTILRALAGLPTHVDVKPRIGGEDPQTWSAAKLRQVAYVPQDARDRLVGLTVAGEARLRGLRRDDVRDVGTLSTGEAAQVALDLLDAPIWLLDEPASHLDDEALETLRQRMEAHEGTLLYTDPTGRLNVGIDHELAPTEKPTIQWPEPSGPTRLTTPEQRHHVSLPATAWTDGIHVLTGANGSGKTSLLRVLAGLEGTAQLMDRPVEPGMAVYLGPDPWPHLVADRVGDLVAAGPLVPTAWLDRHPWTLSTGEAQRVALAKVLARPGPLLMDEPEAHLDGASLHILGRFLAERGGTIIVASHHPSLIAAGHEVRL